MLTQKGGFTGQVTGLNMVLNSLILGIGFAVGKIVLSMTAAYAIVYFRFRFATLAFWIIFTTLLLAARSAHHAVLRSDEQTGPFELLHRSHRAASRICHGTSISGSSSKSVPEELLEAARIDGRGPVKFFIDVLVPLSRTMMSAIFIIMFVYGWNQYLWPMLMTTDESFFTLMRGIKSILQVWVGSQIPDYNEAFALAVLAMLPPVLIVVIFQRWFIKGLTESDK